MSTPIGTRRTRAHWILALSSAALGMIAAIAMGRMALPARAWDVFKAFVVFGLAAGVLGAIVTSTIGRGASAAGRGVAALLALVGTAALVGGVLLGVNKLADNSPGVTHQAVIAKKQTGTAGPNSSAATVHYVSVASWIDTDGHLIELPVSGYAAWNAMQKGDTIAVVAHEGRLGWPWVETYGAR